MKQPLLPNKLPVTELAEVAFNSHDEYVRLRFEHGNFVGQKAEFLVLKQVVFQYVRLDDSLLYSPKLTDVRLAECSLANTNCERLIAHRVEITDCRLLGLNVTEGHFQDVGLRDCDVQLARFRFCTFKSATFDNCNLKGANFQGADLSGVCFRRCDLRDVEMSQTKLKGADFRTSRIEGLKVGAEEVVGAVVDHIQAAYLASLLGLVIKSEYEE